MAQLVQQVLEQGEGFGLVLVQRIALAIAAQADHAAQVVQMDQVLAPLHVDHLQHELLFEATGLVGSDQLQPLGRASVGCGLQPLLDLLVGHAFLGRPLTQRQFEPQRRADLFVQPLDVPLLGIGLGRHVAFDQVGHHFATEVADQFGQVGGVHELLALFEHRLALVVHDVVVLQQVLADVVVALLDPLLRGLDGAVQPGVGDRLALGHAERLHDRVETVAGENAQQVVLARQIEFRHAGVALPTGAATELIVDAAAFVAFGAEHEKAAGGERLLLLYGDVRLELGFLGGFRLGRDLQRHVALLQHPLLHPHLEVAAQLDVGAASGHVGGDGDRARQARVRHDIGFLLVLARVQDVVRNAAQPGLVGDVIGGVADLFRLLGLSGVFGLQRARGFDLVLIAAQEIGQLLRPFDRHGADQDGLTGQMALGDLARDRLVLLGVGAIDLVVVVLALDRPVGRHLQYVHLVDVAELLRLGRGGAGHARQLLVQAEVVLDGDRGQGLVLGLDLDAFLGLDGLMQAFGQAAPRHHAAGELVDQDDLFALDDVVLVALVQGVGAQGLVGVVHQADVGGVIQAGGVLGEMAALLQRLLDPLRPFFGQQDLLLLFVQLVGRLVGDQLFDQAVQDLVQVRAVLGRARDDQGRARLVDQDGVDLVDDGEVVRALHHLAPVIDQVVAQIVEAELVVGAIGDVGGVGRLTLALAQAVDDHPDFKTEEAIDPAHGLGVASRQIVVDGDHVHALARQRVQIHRRHGHQRLALAGPHLGDAALVQDHAAGQLHVVLTLAQHPLGGLAHHGEGFRQDLVQAFAALQPVLEGVRHHPQLVVGQGGELGLQHVDALGLVLESLDLAVVGRAEEFLGEAEHVGSGRRSGVLELERL